ncbi:extracellular solute-binding protein [Actinomadura sp. NEAU-AAG7]|uniref:extracellular solute-binding protein n=1 Tax=Actinomadura sp. NEAU-AAG7 TaxID=2839640 RepID=UPI001BE479B8|nr:extracellular solute-binding protein [Actinomadura sp. NEAU-AAG7]MBT2213984.1 extracellular solute-binding protein [Actinomadura sp. NEAU-AAG7]
MNPSAVQVSAVAGALAALVALVAYPRVASGPSGAGCAPGAPLVVVGGKDPIGVRQALVGEWAGRRGLRARFRHLPLNSDMEHSELVSTARSGGCDGDVYILDTPWTPEFARAGYIRPLDDLPQAGLRPIIPDLLRTGRYRGRLWTVPLNTDAPLLIYRTDLVRRVPATQAELREQARAVMGPGTRLKAGLMLQLDRYEGFTVDMLELVRDQGGDITVGEDGKVAMDRAAVRAALRDLANAMRGERPVISPASLEADETAGVTAFKNGEVAFLRDWPAFYTLLLNSGSEAAKHLDAVPYPGERVLGGQSLALAASLTGERARAARELVEYLTDRERQRRLFACGGWAPVREDAYQGPRACGSQGAPNEEVVLHAEAPVIRRAVASARPRPSSVYYPEVSRVLRDRLRDRLRCMTGTADCSAQGGDGQFLDDLEEALGRAARGRVR